MLTVFVRVFLIYTVLIITMRLMGKRQIGEMQVSELVTTILLSELAAAPIADTRVPMLFSVIPVTALISIEVIISFAVTRIPALKPIFDGKPSILIRRGILDLDELSRVRISLEELLSELRIAGISDPDEVDYAILEHNGRLSVIPKRKFSPPTSDELSREPREIGLAHAVVVDAKVSKFDLSLINKDEKWLAARLKAHKTPLSDVLLFTVDDGGEEKLVKKR